MKAKDLKNSILQMAIEGKLVPQDPADEPASALLERIREERRRLVAEGKAKFPKAGESVIYTGPDGTARERRVDAKGRVLSDKSIAGEVPFDLPEGWAWARLEDCCKTIVDCPHSTPQYLDAATGFTAVDTNCMDDEWNLTGLRNLSEESYAKRVIRYVPKRGDIVFSREGSIGRSVILDSENTCLGQRVMLLSCDSRHFFNSYCQVVLSSPYAWGLYLAANVGTGAKHINVATVKEMLIPLPPLAEQHRIVERVGELMPLVEEYGKLEDARRALDAALPARLRTSVLQEAVQGKLVPQDPADEPASALLERIREERRRLVAEGKAKFPKAGESVIYTGPDGTARERRVDAKGRVLSDKSIAGEVPFDLPEGWAWARLESFFTKMGSGSTPAGGRKVYKDEGPMLLRSQNVHNDGLRLDGVAHFDRAMFESRGSHVLPNDMLLNITGASIGRCAIVPGDFGEADVNQHVLVMRPVTPMTSAYLHLAIISPVVQAAIMGAQVGATKEGLSAAKAMDLLIPLPPLAEQRRIVERAGELMPLIDGFAELEG